MECPECGGSVVMLSGGVMAFGFLASNGEEEVISGPIFKCVNCGFEFEEELKE